MQLDQHGVLRGYPRCSRPRRVRPRRVDFHRKTAAFGDTRLASVDWLFRRPGGGVTLAVRTEWSRCDRVVCGGEVGGTFAVRTRRRSRPKNRARRGGSAGRLRLRSRDCSQGRAKCGAGRVRRLESLTTGCVERDAARCPAVGGPLEDRLEAGAESEHPRMDSLRVREGTLRQPYAVPQWRVRGNALRPVRSPARQPLGRGAHLSVRVPPSQSS
jgi:hypothetical protein